MTTDSRDLVCSVVTGKPVNISASALSTYQDCKRKWWYSYVAKLPYKPHPSAVLGTQVHAHLARYLIDGTKPPPERQGAIALAGLHLLPKPGIGTVETRVSGKCGPLNYKGFVDWNLRPQIIDHKTTSDLKYVLRPEGLARSPQMLLYTRALWHEDPPKIAKLRHIYYATRGVPTARSVEADASWRDVKYAWNAAKDTAEKMVPLILEPDENKILPSVQACAKYGGCPFAGTCADSPQNRGKKLERQLLARKNPTKIEDKTMGKAAKEAKQREENREKMLGKEGAANPPDAASDETPGEMSKDERKAKRKEAAKVLSGMLDVMGGNVPRSNAESALTRHGLDASDLEKVIGKIEGATWDGESVTRGNPEKLADNPNRPEKEEKQGEPQILETEIDDKHRKAIDAVCGTFQAGTPVSQKKMKDVIGALGIWERVHAKRIEAIVSDGATLGRWRVVDGGIVLGNAAPSDGKEADRAPSDGKEADRAPKEEKADKAPKEDRVLKPLDGGKAASAAGHVVLIGAIVEGYPVIHLSALLAPIERALVLENPKLEAWQTVYTLPFNDGAKAVAGKLASEIHAGRCLNWQYLYCEAGHPALSQVLPVLRLIPGTLIVRGTV